MSATAPPAEYPFLWTPTIKGRPYAYVRRAGKRQRVLDAKGTPVLQGEDGFEKAYKATLAKLNGPGIASVSEGKTLSALIRSFQATRHWRELAPRTRRLYERRCRILDDRWGTAWVPTLDRTRVLQSVKATLEELPAQARGGRGRKRYSGAPSTVNECIKMLRLLVGHAIDKGWMQVNPVLRVPELSTGDGYRMWTEDHYRRFITCDDMPEFARRAVVLLYWTGMRRADACKLRKSDYDQKAGTITYVAQKTRKSVPAPITVPVSRELRDWLSRAPATDHDRLLSTETGLPMTEGYLGRLIRELAPTASLPRGLSAHGLRLGIVSALAEAGASDAEIEAMVPHSRRMTQHYRRQASQPVLARAALARLEAAGTSDKPGTDKQRGKPPPKARKRQD